MVPIDKWSIGLRFPPCKQARRQKAPFQHIDLNPPAGTEESSPRPHDKEPTRVDVASRYQRKRACLQDTSKPPSMFEPPSHPVHASCAPVAWKLYFKRIFKACREHAKHLPQKALFITKKGSTSPWGSSQGLHYQLRCRKESTSSHQSAPLAEQPAALQPQLARPEAPPGRGAQREDHPSQQAKAHETGEINSHKPAWGVPSTAIPKRAHCAGGVMGSFDMIPRGVARGKGLYTAQC